MPVYRAAWVLPVAAPPIFDGTVTVDGGRILEVGPARRHPGEVRDLGEVALLPGLVNAHVHVELSFLAQDARAEGHFFAWLDHLVERRATEDESRSRAAAAAAIEQMVSRGTVACGDVANGEWAAAELARSSLEGVSFHEVFDPRADRAPAVAAAAGRRMSAMRAGPEVLAAGGRWRIALAPHAPHTTSEPLLREIAAAGPSEPLSIHVAETSAEIDWVRDGTGPFGPFFRSRGVLDGSRRGTGETPVELLDRLGLLSPRTLAVHCVHLSPDDRTRLGRRGVHVVTCPRSNARLGTGTAPVPDLLADGISLALGTDSLASAPDLDLFAEMAALRSTHPTVAASDVVHMATLGGARALGLDADLGSIEPGKRDRLVVVELAEGTRDPLEALCSSPGRVLPLERARWRGMRT